MALTTGFPLHGVAALRAALAAAVRRGGVRLKLVGLIALTVLLTVGLLSYLFIGLMQRAMTDRSLQVAHASLERLAEVSQTALLERTDESRLDLDEVLQALRVSSGGELLDAAVYATEKGEEGRELRFFSGFAESRALAPAIARSLLEGDGEGESVVQSGLRYVTSGGTVDAYRFVKPVLLSYQGKVHLLGAVLLTYTREAVLGPVRSVLRIAAATTAAVLVLGVFLAYFLGSRLSRPIISVAAAAREVARGRLDTQLNLATGDEFEALGREFNLMVQGLREREHMQRYVSHSTLEMIRSAGDEEVRLGGEHRTLTLLFSDIRGFTAMAEEQPPERVVSVVNFYLSLQTAIIRRHGGDIDKFVGDEVMAAFYGARSVERAIAAALEIQRSVAARNGARRRDGEVTVEVGIGIHHGPVVVGNIGAYERMDFTSIGRAVNFAARLCSEAGPGEVLMEADLLRRHAGPDWEARPLGPVAVKGLAEPVEVVAVEARSEHPVCA